MQMKTGDEMARARFVFRRIVLSNDGSQEEIVDIGETHGLCRFALERELYLVKSLLDVYLADYIGQHRPQRHILPIRVGRAALAASRLRAHAERERSARERVEPYGYLIALDGNIRRARALRIVGHDTAARQRLHALELFFLRVLRRRSAHVDVLSVLRLYLDEAAARFERFDHRYIERALESAVTYRQRPTTVGIGVEARHHIGGERYVLCRLVVVDQRQLACGKALAQPVRRLVFRFVLAHADKRFFHDRNNNGRFRVAIGQRHPQAVVVCADDVRRSAYLRIVYLFYEPALAAFYLGGRAVKRESVAVRIYRAQVVHEQL